MEDKTPVRPLMMRWLCDICGEEMRGTGLAFMTDPPIYEHSCPNGHKEEIRGKQYPYIDFVPIEGEQLCDDSDG